MSTQTRTSAQRKRLAIFLDGTWNSVLDNTNVWRLRALCATSATGDFAQLAYYDIGVNGFRGGVFGKGLIRNVTDAYEWLVANYTEGDEIFIFGFSRGAFTARSLAGFVTKYGLLKPGAPLSVRQLFERYRRRTDKTIRQLAEDHAAGLLKSPNLEESWMLRYSLPVPIKLVGVWDTVGALGIPAFSWEGISRSTFRFLDTGLRVPIENAFHALAVDEHRKGFAPTLWTKRLPNDPSAKIAAPRTFDSVEQRWFAGAHGNVGGGYPNDLLAQSPLRWIMKKANSHGLSFRDEVDIDEGALAAPIADSYADFLRSAYSKVSARYHRPIGVPPNPDPDATYINVNETIDASIFDRWRHDSAYRPPNLAAWGDRKKVDISTIEGSVSADDPGAALSE